MEWIKSTFCHDSGCVEMTWAKSSASAVNNCAETTFGKSSASTHSGNSVEAAAPVPCGADDCNGECLIPKLRDSKDPQGPVLKFSAGTWDGGRGVGFTPVEKDQVPLHLAAEALKSGHGLDSGWYRVTDGKYSLYFHQDEVDAWNLGVAAGEFAVPAFA